MIYDLAGIRLADKKISLVKARIAKRIRALNLKNEKEYLDYISSSAHQEELVQLIDVISTNVTHFFRENGHFEFLKSEFSKWIAGGQKRFRIWSAGCSSGQEPYTIAMVLLDTLNTSKVHAMGIDLKILATDISTQILQKAKAGVYPENKMGEIPPRFKNLFFNVERSHGEKVYTVKNNIKSIIKFGRLNLSKTPFPMKGPMDIIFCRNTMIYFDNSVRSRLVSDFYRLLKPDGYLMVGHSESLTGFNTNLIAIRPSVYIKKSMIQKKVS